MRLFAYAILSGTTKRYIGGVNPMNFKNFEKQTEKSTVTFQVEVDGEAFEKAVAAAYQKSKKDIFGITFYYSS